MTPLAEYGFTNDPVAFGGIVGAAGLLVLIFCAVCIWLIVSKSKNKKAEAKLLKLCAYSPMSFYN